MTKPAFIVEGRMEQKLVQKICPNAPVRLINCTGDSVSMGVMAKFISTQIRLLNNRNYPIIIIFDRERRNDTCEEIISNLLGELKKQNIDVEVIIGVADRTIENWILSDIKMLKKEYKINIKQSSFEGTFGKAQLKKILNNKIKYHETTIGVDMFLKCCPKEMFSNSKSFKKFVSSIDFDCWWLKDIPINSM